ncbi:MAG: hypothetical protein K5657_01370 [Desulfovibrio sp.]|nr:hypothetical protein [Desulfovibrio sp.]
MEYDTVADRLPSRHRTTKEQINALSVNAAGNSGRNVSVVHGTALEMTRQIKA